MKNNLNRSAEKTGKKQKMITRLLVPMIFLILFQLVTFFSVLTLGGEFTFIRKYAYDTLVEKTRNRKNYVESELCHKLTFVEESASEINSMIMEKLDEDGKDISCIKTDKALNREIMESSVDKIVSLLQRSLCNDAYLILETGDLYTDSKSEEAKAGIYLRDLDPSSQLDYDDLLMEMGYSSISKDFGIILDSGWKAWFEPDPQDNENYDFYYDTIRNAEENDDISFENLGHWSGFSKIDRNGVASMKYTIPLIADDGTVYGVLGIGLTEKTILVHLPPNDFVSESACYVLCKGKDDENIYNICMHSGAAFSRLVGTQKTLEPLKSSDDDMYDLKLESNIDAVGNVQVMNLYDSESFYVDDQWALISVAERNDVLFVFTNLIKMLIISALISVATSIIVIVISGNNVVKPISTVIKTMNAQKEYNQVLRFQSSNIYELDKLTNAITQLQINVQDFSSQVSKMIRVADVGLYMFMYNNMDDSVFVGQSMLKLLRLPVSFEGDIVIKRDVFMESIIADETRDVIAECFKINTESSETSFSKEYSITKVDGSVIWMRLGVVCTRNKIIGVLQDITNMVLEKQRIEYERDYDGTTGLLNRHAYYRKINELFSHKEKLKITAFLMLDLDNLKYVNDTYGHDFGDDYIRTAAIALKGFQKYNGIVSRLSGDEFNVCLWGFSSKEEIRAIISEIRSELLNSYCLLSDGTHYKIRGSMGISWYPYDSTSSELLMKYADFAMYTIKHTTKGEIAEFDMNAYTKDSVLITGVEEMNKIIDECRVKYAFHSIISAKTGEIYGYEALMRPQSSILHSPAELLRIAKTGAKLYEIERLTWTESLKAFRIQVENGNIKRGTHIFINTISNSVLEEPDVETIEQEYGEFLSNIVMEVTESENVNEKFNKCKIERLKRWNAHLALDDFGMGYNSEYALITLHPDIIKIDRSIISGCDKDISRRTIICSLVNLARTKNVSILAEGVETEGELKTVIESGVDYLQGYFINRPVFEPEPVSQEVIDKIRKYNRK